MPTFAVSGCQQRHESGNLSIRIRCQDKVEVVGHHAVCEEPDRDSGMGEGQTSNEGLVVTRIREELSLPGSPIQNMEHDPSGRHTAWKCHAPI
jgi:hypothetical protein